MSSVGAAKIRFVKCPKCRKILPEFQDLPVYECGGCGTRLQAKGWRHNEKRTLALQENGMSAAFQRDNKNCAYEDKESTSSSHEAVFHHSGECSLDHINANNQIKYDSCDTEQLGSINLKDEDQNNGSVENESAYLGNDKLGSSNFSNGDHKDERNKSKLGFLEVVNLSKGSPTKRNHQNKPLGCNLEQPKMSKKVSSLVKPTHRGTEEMFLFSGGHSDAELYDQSSPSSGVNAKIESENSSSSSSGKCHTEKLADTKGSNMLEGTCVAPETLVASPNEQLRYPDVSHYHVFECVRSTETFETTDVDPSSELSGTLLDLSKSPKTRSSRAYYDDVVSSCEGTDDQLSNHRKNSYRKVYRPVHHSTSDEDFRRENTVASGILERQILSRNYPSLLSDKTQNDRKLIMLDQDELPDPARLHHSTRDWSRLQEDECQSKLTFSQRNMAADYENGGPSNPLHNEFHSNAGFNSHDRLAYTGQEKLKLLRIVHELKDQLRKVSIPNEKGNGRLSSGTGQDLGISMSHEDEFSEEENFYNRYDYAAGVRELKNWPYKNKHWRTPFSAAAANFRHHVDHSLCCCPKDLRRSAQMPPGIRHNKGLCSVHPDINLYLSCPSSPLRPVESEFQYNSLGAYSENQSYRVDEVKKYSTKNNYSAKRHVRPMAGGAPFITCPRCLNLLHLSSDFLLIKRRCHRVICYGCSEALKFTLVSGSHLIPYMPGTKTPPPSEVDEDNGATTTNRRRRRVLVQNGNRHANPMSYSDEYGLSLSESTTVADRDPSFSHTSFNDTPTQRNVSQNKHKDATGPPD
ncbi:hypothetical protein K2173_023363 [Erythroxylum novogranatense]|uniref:Zinc-ribbon domain-containing protein n=1 Tax=Erythroxylum novogranatense TaxID=1862640 RepID=A0AAV8TY30_9ROSI|nr:hypothetical protein K2173_023363 [Erythroxylum novogranatense]